MNTCTSLETFSEVIFSSEMTASLAGTSCFAGSTCVKGADTEAFSTEGTYTRSSCIEAASIGGTGGASIRGNSVRGTD